MPNPAQFECFGKLPNHVEFITLSTGRPESRALVQWLEKGARGAAESLETAVFYVWTPRDASHAPGPCTLVGVLWPSRDAFGRSFPFTIYTSWDRGQLAAYGSRVLLAMSGVRRNMLMANERLQKLAPDKLASEGAGILRQFEGVGLPSPPEVARTWSDRVSGAALLTDSAEAAAGHALNLARVADDLLDKDGPASEFALHIQLLGREGDLELGAWAQLLCRRLGASEADQDYFLRWTRGTLDGFLFHRPIRPSDVGFVLGPQPGYAYSTSLLVPPRYPNAVRDRLADQIRGEAPSGATFRDVLRIGGEVPRGDAEKYAVLLERERARETQELAAAREASSASDVALDDLPVLDATASQTDETLVPQTDETPSPQAEEEAAPHSPPPAPAPRAEEPSPHAAPSARGAAEPAPPVFESRRPAAGADDLAWEIERLARERLLPGEILPATWGAAAGVIASSMKVHVYWEESARGRFAVLLSAEEASLCRRGIDDGARARSLLAEIRRRHDEIEARLEREIQEAMDRTPRPGEAAGA